MNEFQKITLLNAVSLAFISVVLAVYVLYYNSGPDSGVLYRIYLVYASIMLFIVNILVGIENLIKRGMEDAKPFFLTGFIVGISALIIGFAGGAVIQFVLQSVV